MASFVRRTCVIISATVKHGRIRSILQSANYMGRIAKWYTVLGVFDIKYMSCISVKGQVLKDLVAELIEPPLEEVAATQSMDGKSVGTISLQEPLFWKVYVNGTANQKGLRSEASSGFCLNKSPLKSH